MSEDDYDQRKGTVREWIREQKAKDPNWKPPKPEGPPPGPESVEGMSVGARCEVMPGKRRGSVGYLGEVEGLAPGYWVGVKLDEPVGRNDGTRGGKTYFECAAGFGS